jgi:chitosanase
LIERTHDRVGTPDEAGEANWRECADRVESLRRIAATGNYDLAGPITFTVYGDEFTID